MKYIRPVFSFAASLLLLLAMEAAALSSAPSYEFDGVASGALTERVTCRTDASQSYALFLPSSYTPEKRWPVLYCFDPAARGAVPVERFKDAAEKYGYILVGSNNSRNGPNEVALAALKAMWDDTRSRFSLDEKRVYMAGFSGGARVACMAAHLLEGQVAGVIACGGGFPPNIKPSRTTPFVFFGTAGNLDFNFPEMKRLDRDLHGYGVAHRLAVFEGDHDWAPKEVCAEAIEWMELQAMKSGRRERSDALVEQLLKRRVERAQSQEAAGESYAAYSSYYAIAEDFKGLKDTAEFERRASALRSSEAVKRAMKEERQQEEKQALRAREFYQLKMAVRNSDDSAIAFNDLKNLIADLKKKAAEKASSSDHMVARRLLGMLFVSSVEEARFFTERKDYHLASFNLIIAYEIRPDSPRVFYNLACVYSLSGEKKKALEALDVAVKKGFANLKELEGNKDLDSLREESHYKRIVEALKSKG